MQQSQIRSIETQYNGYRFRSRLEARAAVFFDAAGVEYEYEPEGFILSDGSWYLPDFYVKPIGKEKNDWGCGNCGWYVEVKGSMDDKEGIRKAKLLDNTYLPNVWGVLLFTPDILTAKGYSYFEVFTDDGQGCYMPTSLGSFAGHLDVPADLAIKAQKKAKAARFEHGEHP